MKRSIDDVNQGVMSMNDPNKRSRSDEATRNLMVNYLPKSMDEAAFTQLFLRYGEIERSKLMMEQSTGESKCFGFVKFVEPACANAALQELNGYEIEGKKLRVAYSSRPICDVFFSGFGANFTTDQLKQLASKYGTVLDAKILDPAKHPRGVGFVQFSEPREAQACIEDLNGLECGVDGQTSSLIVKYAKSKEERTRGAGGGGGGGGGFGNNNLGGNNGGNMQNMFGNNTLGALGGMGMGNQQGGNMDLQQQLFLSLLANQGTNLQSLGLGSLQPNLAALGGLGNLGGGSNSGGGGGMGGGMGGGGMGGGGMGGGGGVPNNVLFVRGFFEANESEAMQLFEGFGCTRVDVPKGREGKPKNFCFVHFSDQTAAQNAMNKMNGFNLPNGRSLQVKFRGSN
eukprot:TRINITY_DN2106_c3_g3_i1.p1 TRINITY_DN2106_c3_g3~~TRINITY_DN2106_c3_g3_i1.p1  ORF type:complete len:398 (+),score=117.74 TRINITY_DN2106_c3_g3_i1:53-1246(+)